MIAGCASGISSRQKTDYDAYKAMGLAQEEKSPAAGAALGLLPGGGSFYGREYGLGIVNLLFWPLSILWDPISGINASERINYTATKNYVRVQKNREINQLNQNRMAGLVDDNTYRVELMRINQKFDIDAGTASYQYIAPVQTQQKATQTDTQKQQQVRELEQQNLPYAEYQRRYQQIMNQ